jgi:carbonic anhydrase
VLGREGLGSIDYAVENLGEGLRLLVVLGHSQCGAVTAAVDAFLRPANYLDFASRHHLRAIVDSQLPSVRAASMALADAWGPDVDRRPGYRRALIETAVVFNVALTAGVLQKEFAGPTGRLQVVFGVYDLASRRVRVPLAGPPEDEVRLLPPPRDLAEFEQLARQMVGGPVVRALLSGPG